MSCSDSKTPHWAARLGELISALQAPTAPSAPSAALSEGLEGLESAEPDAAAAQQARAWAIEQATARQGRAEPERAMAREPVAQSGSDPPAGAGRDGSAETARPSCREAARAEAWLLLNTALLRYLHPSNRRGANLSREDREDVAAEKSLDLLARAESGTWCIDGRSPAEIAAFVAKAGWHGAVDHNRREAKWVWSREDREGETEALPVPDAERRGPPSPAARVEQREFALALKECATHLQPRARRAWFFRVFYDLSTKEIAAHPEIALQPAHVDVLLQRCRESARECMHNKGYESADMSQGTFAELWKAFRAPGASGE